MDILYSRAKINLFLHIVGRNKKNYHNIQSVMSFINLHDEIIISDSDSLKIDFQYNEKIIFPIIDQSNNSIIKIINNFSNLINKKITLDIKVKKNIPTGGGLGGGSTNAATILRYLQNKYKCQLPKKTELSLALKIGYDTIPCLYNRTLIAESVGDQILACELDEELQNSHILIIYPQIISLSSSSYELFKNENINFSPQITIPQIITYDFLKRQHNDLNSSLIKQFPETNELIELINKLNIQQNIITRMSGSGSTFFVLSKNKNQIESIKYEINTRFPDYFTGIYNFIA